MGKVEEEGRILAIDYGKRRVGFAISDPGGKVAFPLETVDLRKENILHRIEKIYSEKPFKKVILGKPPRKELLFDVLFLACFLKRRYKLEVIFWNEEYTSKEAEEILRGMGIKINRKNKHIVDSLSAYIILCEYLGYRPYNSFPWFS
mgnify:CR=1 FL=1|jgi:conserved hypothetical protein TIGR00250